MVCLRRLHEGLTEARAMVNAALQRVLTGAPFPWDTKVRMTVMQRLINPLCSARHGGRDSCSSCRRRCCQC